MNHNHQNIQQIIQKNQQQINLIKKYENLIRFSIVDYFISPMTGKIIESFNINKKKKQQEQNNQVKKYKKTIQKLKINQILLNSINKVQEKQQNININIFSFNFEKYFKQIQSQSKKLSTKKKHQIKLFGQFILQKVNTSFLSKQYQQNITIIDIGCGLGYLTQLISLLFISFKNISILGIDSCGQRINSAKSRSNNKNLIQYHQGYFPQCQIFQQFCIKQQKFILISLHGCGLLTDNLIKTFKQNQNCLGLFIIPCCYNLIDWKGQSYKKIYSQLKEDQDFFHRLGMLACQSILDQQNKEGQYSLEHIKKSLGYRAILQKVIYDDNKTKQVNINNNIDNNNNIDHKQNQVQPQVQPFRIGKVNTKKITSFDQYLNIIITKQKLPINISNQLLLLTKEQIQKYQTLLNQNIKQIQQIWTLRCQLGPLVENFINVNRVVDICQSYKEKDKEKKKQEKKKKIKIQFHALFDRQISPRNCSIYAKKLYQ